MDLDGTPRGDELEPFRTYLLAIAQQCIPLRLRKHLDPEDLVQDTFRKALESGMKGVRSLKDWLRQILRNRLSDRFNEITNKTHNIDLEKDLEFSSCRLADLVAADHSSPSERAIRNEDSDRLTEALARLPAHQREVVILHRIHGMKLVEIASHLDVTLGVVAGRLREGVANLRHALDDGAEP